MGYLVVPKSIVSPDYKACGSGLKQAMVGKFNPEFNDSGFLKNFKIALKHGMFVYLQLATAEIVSFYSMVHRYGIKPPASEREYRAMDNKVNGKERTSGNGYFRKVEEWFLPHLPAGIDLRSHQPDGHGKLKVSCVDLCYFVIRLGFPFQMIQSPVSVAEKKIRIEEAQKSQVKMF